ncbi:MAG: WYL domain-containing protein [Actinomycetes bacterium]
MSETALDRASRALDLIPFIVENPGISIEDLATVFGSTPKEITKDLNLLFVCGLPGYSPLELIDLSFDDGYVSVIDAQTLDKPRKLSRREVFAVILGLEGMTSLRAQGDPLRAEIEELRSKLATLISGVNIKIASLKVGTTPTPFLSHIETSLRERTLLDITYLSGHRDTETQRTIRPNFLYVENGFIYLRAFCLTSHGERTFRVDRIIELESKGQASALDFEKALPIKSEVFPTIEIGERSRGFLEENRHLLEIPDDFSYPLATTIAVSDREWLLRTCLGQRGGVSILAPADLATELAQRRAETLALYG